MKIDPRVAKDGITAADLAEQTKLALKVRDQLAEARQLATRVRQAIQEKRGDQTRLQGVLDRLVTKAGPYEDQMFIDQLSNVGREIGQADQKVGASAFERFNQLLKGVGRAQGGCRSRPALNERCAKPSAGTSFTAEGCPLTFERTASRSGVICPS